MGKTPARRDDDVTRALHAIPRARLLQDGSWVARYEGLPLEGHGDSEDASKQDLAWKFNAWLFSEDGEAGFDALMESGGTPDLIVHRLPRGEAGQLLTAATEEWKRAVGLEPPSNLDEGLPSAEAS